MGSNYSNNCWCFDTFRNWALVINYLNKRLKTVAIKKGIFRI